MEFNEQLSEKSERKVQSLYKIAKLNEEKVYNLSLTKKKYKLHEGNSININVCV